MELAAYDGSDGYISDVPGNNDYAHSDVSNDFVESSRTLERHFQDKYKMLRHAYEDRILKLTSVVEETCSKLFSDELLNELKQDKTSAAFIPAHLSEVISNQLHSERERHMHQMFEKVGVLEVENGKSNKLIVALKKQLAASDRELTEAKRAGASCAPLTQNMQSMEKNFREYVESSSEETAVLQATIEKLRANEKQLSNKLEIVKFELSERNKAYETMKHQLQAKNRDIDTLEQSFEQSSRELAMIEGMEKQEQVLKKEMKEQLRTLTEQKHALSEENQQLRVKMQYASDELDRCHLIAQQKEADEAANKQKITDLMAQVESMLTQEADESNCAISAVHEKMKIFRQRMAAEISREKRLNSALQEELAAAIKARNDSIFEQKRLEEQASQLRDQLEKEQHDMQILQRNLNTETEQGVVLRRRLAEVQAQCTRADHIRSEYERLKHSEASLIEERAQLKSNQEKAAEHSHLEKRLEASRVHYENELTELRKQLKNAYSFDKNGQSVDPTSEVSQKSAIQSWAQESARLKQRHAADLAAINNQLRKEYGVVIEQLTSRLEEAVANLDKLKDMVRNGKSVIRTQSSQLESLKTEVNLLKQYQGLDQQSTGGRNASRMASSSAARRSSTVLSPAHTSEAVRDHRAAIALRSHSTPRPAAPAMPSMASPVTVPAPQASQIPSRRSSTSSIGFVGTLPLPLQSFNSSPAPSPPVSARSSVADSNIQQTYLDQISLHQRTAKHATDEVAVLKEQINQLLEEGQRYQANIRELESARNLLSAQVQSSSRRASIVVKDEASTSVPWESSVNNSILQAKVDEICSLRDELADIKAHAAEEAINLQNEIDHLRAEISELKSQNTHLSTMNAQLEEDNEHHMASLSEANAKIANLNVTQESALDTSGLTRHLEQSLQHQSDLVDISAAELSDERGRVREMRKREVKLFQLLANVQKHYQSQIHLLRQDLTSVRASVQTIGPYTQLEVRKTVGGLANKLHAIFAHFQRKQEQELKSARIELSRAHTEEINSLEGRFTQQIARMATEQTAELEQVHGQLVKKAEDALGFNAYIDSVAVEVDDSIEEDELNNSTASAPSQQSRRSVSFARDLTASGGIDRKLQRRSSAPNALTPTPVRRQSGTSAFSTSLKPAFESVLNGLIEALQAEDMLDAAGSQQLMSLAKAHQEPSFAAQAAAKSLVSGHLEKFVNDLLTRSLNKLNGTATKAAPGTSTVVSRNQGYSSADYALFFDS